MLGVLVLVTVLLAPRPSAATLVSARFTEGATHYVVRAQLGLWLKLAATLLGRVPPDSHVWILADEVPAFVKFEGPLLATGPVWQIVLTSPRWPDEPQRRPALNQAATS